MQYIKIQFTSGMECIAYQEVDAYGRVVRLIDEFGADLVIPEKCMAAESKVISDDPKIKAEVEAILKVPPSPSAVEVICKCKPAHECV